MMLEVISKIISEIISKIISEIISKMILESEMISVADDVLNSVEAVNCPLWI